MCEPEMPTFETSVRLTLQAAFHPKMAVWKLISTVQ